MGDQLPQQQGLALEIEDPQAALGRRQREVDDRQALGRLGAIVEGALHGRQGMTQDLLVEGRRRLRQAFFQRGDVGGVGHEWRRDSRKSCGQPERTNQPGHGKGALSCTDGPLKLCTHHDAHPVFTLCLSATPCR
ncbi:hypothetical protein D3C78_1437650 [compost metagenome]